MIQSAASLGRQVRFYLFAGLIFLLWENLVNSILGNYHFELRRTLWGIVYYGLLFLCFGGLTEALNYFYSRIFRRHCWAGQKAVWFLTILLIFLWGDLFRQLLIQVFRIASAARSYELTLSWWPLTLAAASFANVILAKWSRSRQLSPTLIPALSSAFALYLIISTKVVYAYFQADYFSAVSFLLQPLFALSAWAIFWILMKWSGSIRIYLGSLMVVPVLLTLVVVVVSSGGASTGKAASERRPLSPDKPNVILMVFDALRADHVGPSRSGASLTPTLDRLAALGRSYPVCRSFSSWTFPAVVSLLTSRLPNELGLIEPGILPAEIPTVAGVLHRHGYFSAGLSANDLVTARYGFDRSYDDFHFLRGRGSRQLFLPFDSFFPSLKVMHELAYQFDFSSTDLLAADWRQMNGRAAQMMEKSAGRPLFLHMHYIEPHSPYWAVPFSGGLLDLDQLKLEFRLSFGHIRQSTMKALTEERGAAELLATQHQRYEGGVRIVDQAVADLMQKLERLGMAENTIIIITADHGEEFMEHGHVGHKSSLFEELVRIPLIIYVPPSLRIRLPEPQTDASILDIAPTILQLAGVANELPECAGKSLLDTTFTGVRPSFLSVEVGQTLWRGVVFGSHKLIIRSREQGEADTLLYDLAADRREMKNLYPAEAALADSLASLFHAQLERPSGDFRQEPVKLTPQEIQRLRALGYTN